MSEKRINKSYSKAFKEEAVALITEQGYSVAEGKSGSCSEQSTVSLETRTGSLKIWKYAQSRRQS